jgi:hypothetical protein
MAKFENSLINYARVRKLKGDFEISAIKDALSKNISISYENEISSWMFYYNSVKKTIGKISLDDSIYETQLHRNYRKIIEDDLTNEDEKTKKWAYRKIFENIYSFYISYEKILLRHRLGSLNKIIYNVNSEINSLKKYNHS